jgi:uncharacterized protein involved in outer membrane biogenesis
MRWLKYVLVFAGVLIALVVALIAVVLTIDLGRFKPEVESLASDLVGREIRIDGELSPSLGAEIRVVAGGVRIVNPEWAADDDLLRAGKLDVSLDLRSLLSGRYLLNNIEIDDLVVALEQNEDGANNWTLFASDPAEEAVEADEPSSPLDLLIRRARIRDLVVTYVDPASESPLRFQAKSVDQSELESGDIKLDIDGDLNGTPVTVDATAGPFANLLDASSISYELRARVGEIEIASDARIDSLAAPRRPVGRVEITGPNATYLTDVVGIAPITTGPLDLAATLAPVDDRTELAVSGQFGEFELDATGSFTDLQDLDAANLVFDARGPNAATFGALTGLDGIPEVPFSVQGRVARKGPRIDIETVDIAIGETEFDVSATIEQFPSLDGAVINLSLRGPDFGRFNKLLGLPGKLTGPFSADARLGQSAAGEELIDIVADARDIKFRINGVVSPATDFVGTNLSVRVQGDDLSVIAGALDVPDVPAVPFGVTAELSRIEGGVEIDGGVVELGAANELRITADGTVNDPPNLVGSGIDVVAAGKDLARVGSFAGVSGLPPSAFRVGGNVTRREAGFAIGAGKIKIGDDTLSIDGLVGDAPLEKDTDLRFRAAGPDLAGTLRAAGIEIELLPAGDFEAAGRVRRQADHFALDGITARLGGTRAKVNGRLGNLTDFSGTDFDVEIDGDSLAGVAPEISDFRFEDVPFSVASKVRIAKDQLGLAGVKVRIGQGRLDGDVSLSMAPMLGSGNVSVSASGPNIAEWAPSFADFVPADAPFDLSTAANWRDDHLTVEQFVFKLARGQIVANGDVDIAEFSRTNFDLDAQIASMSNLGRIAGTDLPDQPLSLSAKLVGSPKALTLSDFSLTAGPSDVAGTATYDTSGDLPRVDVDVTSRFLDPTPFLPADDAEAAPAATATADDGRLIPDTPIPVDALRELNAKAKLAIGELVLPNGPVKDVRLDGSLQDGALRIERFALAGDRGTLDGKLELLPTAAGARISGNIDGAEMTLGLTPTTPGDLAMVPRYDFQAKLDARGTTVRELASSLDGTLRLVGGGGRTKGVPAWFLRDTTTEIFDTVNPFSKKEGFTSIQCFTILLRSVDGEIDGQPALVLQTDKLNIVGVAFVNLKTEGIDVKIETAARKGLGIGVADFVTPYTKIGGTLASPALGFDAEEAVARGAQTAATLGTSWLAKKVKSRFFGPKDPCGKAVAEADAEMQALEPQ